MGHSVSTLAFAFLGVLLGVAAADAATITVRADGDLQAAIAAAQPGDVILLQPGATYVGNFTLPNKPGADYITIRSAAADALLPKADTRVTPLHAALLPKIKSGNTMPALATAAGAHHWKLMFLEFEGNAGGAGEIIQLGDVNDASASALPRDIIIDRCYIHGHPTAGQKRGIGLNSASTDVLNSYISDIKASGQDSQAICGWNGPGPFIIENNFLEAAGENILFGGADPKIPNLVPSDIVIRRNHLSKPVAWRGTSWTVKNLFELKSAERVTVEYNLFEYNWSGGQSGYAILFTPRNQDGGAPWTIIRDVTFRYNVVRHTPAGINILGRDNNHPSERTARVWITDNLFYDVGGATWGNGTFLLIGDGPADIVVAHNTVSHSGNIVTAYGGTDAEPMPIPGFVFRDNVARHNDYGIFGAGRAYGNDAISVFFPGSEIRRNVIAGGAASRYPPDNFFPSAGDFPRLFVSADTGDYRLVAGSPYLAAASDGTALGADPEGVRTALGAAGTSNTLPRKPTNLRIIGQ